MAYRRIPGDDLFVPLMLGRLVGAIVVFARNMNQSSSARRLGSPPEALQAGAAILRPVLESVADGIVVVDEGGRTLLMNRAAADLLNTESFDSPVAEWPRELGLFLPDQSGPWPSPDFALVRALRGEEVEGQEIFIRNPRIISGAWVQVSARPLRDGQGQVWGATLVLRDLTENRRTAEKLRKERDWTRAVVEASPSLVIVLDRAGRIIGFNRAAEECTGYAFGEVRGKPLWDVLLAPEDAAGVRAKFDELRTGYAANRHENHLVASDGSRRLIQWSNTAVTNSQGLVDCVIGTGIDITEHRRIEDELRQANEMLAAIIQTSPLAIVRMELDGTVRSWNAAAERMFGWKQEEVLGRLFPAVPEDDMEFFRGNMERARRGHTLAGVERERRRKDGSLIAVALWTAVQRDASGAITSVISVIADMTERNRLEEQFRQSQKMEAVGRLAGGVAHDFNNLLTVITGYTQMLMDELEPESPLRGHVEEVLRASESAAALTNQLLAFSRRQLVQPQLVDLNTLVAGMDKMLHRLIGEDIELAIVLNPGPAKVKVDPNQFQQVVMNLVVNARDAMPEGGRLTIKTAGDVHHSEFAPAAPGLPEGDYVLLSVSDTGKGMTDDVKDHLFEPFFTTKGKGKGTGLGLSTVYGIVKQAGGDVAVWSEPGRGTTFRIYLPAAEPAPAAAIREEPVPERQRGTETVLLVEDEAGLRKLVREVLEAHGYTVLQAADCDQALRVCEWHERHIHLILTDLVLPGASGLELAAQVLALRPDLKVLYMSGYTEHVVLDSVTCGTGFLQKPFTPEMLLLKVREVLDRPAKA